MRLRTARVRKVGVTLLGVLVLGAAGCRAPSIDNESTRPYSAYRPAFGTPEPRRTLFLGGYAGYNYGPVATQSEVPTASGGAVWGYPAARPPFSGLFNRDRLTAQ